MGIWTIRAAPPGQPRQAAADRRPGQGRRHAYAHGGSTHAVAGATVVALLSILLLPAAVAIASAAPPACYSQHPGVLEQARARAARGEPSIRASFGRLREEADAARQLAPRTVVDKPLRA